MNKEQIVEEIGRARAGEKLPFEKMAMLIASEAASLTDDEMWALLRGIRVIGGGPVGAEAMMADLVMIIGSEKGLWDDMGYDRQIEFVGWDFDFGNESQNMLATMVYQDLDGLKPWLIRVVLRLKHGVRMIPTDVLQSLSNLVEGTWVNEGVGDELFEWRLLTLRMSLRAVLAMRH